MHKTLKSEIGTRTPQTGVKCVDLGVWGLGFGDCLPKSGSWRVGLKERSAVIGHFFLEGLAAFWQPFNLEKA